MSYEMNELLELVFEQNASDLHLQVGQPPTLRLSGSMTPIDGPALEPIDTEDLTRGPELVHAVRDHLGDIVLIVVRRQAGGAVTELAIGAGDQDDPCSL